MRASTDICVIGGGPAGTVFAARMAQLGHEVCLVERVAFPRHHLGESLSPGVLPLLEAVGARARVEAAGFARVRSVSVNWENGPQERVDPRAEGLLVDRGRFDTLLLDHARACGVRVLQPATVRQRRFASGAWSLDVSTTRGTIELSAGYLADASGRAGIRPTRRRRTGPRTLALHAYWTGARLPMQPRIEAGEDAWYWGVPLPDGTYNTLVFVDPTRYGVRDFERLLERSALLEKGSAALRVGRIHASDATAYVDEQPVTEAAIKVGDAALALDPLSSSGVQKAIQTALAGAVVVNTLRRKPEASPAAVRYYCDTLREASDRHGRWAAEHYRRVAAVRPDAFWRDRAAGLMPGPADVASPPAASVSLRAHAERGTRFRPAPELECCDVPCLEDAFVAVKGAVIHPSLERPVAFVGNVELVPLLSAFRGAMTVQQTMLAWLPRVPTSSGLAVFEWLVGHGLLVPVADDSNEAQLT